jgi:hypothetical protein
MFVTVGFKAIVSLSYVYYPQGLHAQDAVMIMHCMEQKVSVCKLSFIVCSE